MSNVSRIYTTEQTRFIVPSTRDKSGGTFYENAFDSDADSLSDLVGWLFDKEISDYSSIKDLSRDLAMRGYQYVFKPESSITKLGTDPEDYYCLCYTAKDGAQLVYTDLTVLSLMINISLATSEYLYLYKMSDCIRMQDYIAEADVLSNLLET